MHADAPVHLGLGRPRGRGQLRRDERRLASPTEPRERRRRPPGPVRGAAPERLQGVLRGDAADAGQGRPDADLRLGAKLGGDRRAVLHRPAPVPRPAAVQRRDPAAVPRGRRPRPQRMLGAEQKAWFKSAVAGSKATWKLWGSETMVMSLDACPGQGAIQDAWDGYAAERQEILEQLRRRRGPEPRGAHRRHPHVHRRRPDDDRARDGGTPIGVELVGGSATSLGHPGGARRPGARRSTRSPRPNDPHVKFVDLERGLRGGRGRSTS